MADPAPDAAIMPAGLAIWRELASRTGAADWLPLGASSAAPPPGAVDFLVIERCTTRKRLLELAAKVAAPAAPPVLMPPDQALGREMACRRRARGFDDEADTQPTCGEATVDAEVSEWRCRLKTLLSKPKA